MTSLVVPVWQEKVQNVSVRERSPLAGVLEKVAVWGWAAALGAAAALFTAGYSSVHGQQAHIDGRVVTNLAQATATAGQDALTRGASGDVPNDPLACYLSDPGPVYISCGPVIITADLMKGWDNFRVTTHPAGAGVTVTPVNGVVMVGPLPVGTVLTSGSGVLSTVGADQSPNNETMSRPATKAGLSMLGLAAIWLLGSVATAGGRRQRKADRQTEIAAAEAQTAARRSWDDMARLPSAPAVAAPWPVYRPPAPRPDGPPVPVARVDSATGEILDAESTEEQMVPSIGVVAGAAAAAESTVAGGAPTAAVLEDLEPEPSEVAWPGPAILVLGPPMAVGLAVEPDRRVVVELAAYLACHSESVRTAEQVQAALWPLAGSRGDVSLDTVRQHLSRLRRCVGEDNLPDATRAGGYRFGEKVASDWMRFQALAEAARRAEGVRSAGLRRDALGLVRGAPFSGVPAGSYGWAWEELLVARMEAAVTDVAHRLAVEELAAGRPRLADWAAGRGLLAVPTDEILLADRMTAARELSGRPGLDRAWRDAKAVLGEQAQSGPLAEVYERLSR